MIKKVTITNYLGESMTYDIDGVQIDNPSGLIITSIEGLGPVKADINMTDLTTIDGGLYNSARLNKRNIVISAMFTHALDVENARLLSYKYFPIKKPLTFEIETRNRISRTVGYVESNEPDIFSEKTSCKISVLCESPFFESSEGNEITQFSVVKPLLRFKYRNEGNLPVTRFSEIEIKRENTIFYSGDFETGVDIRIKAQGEAKNITIVNNDTGERMVINTEKLKDFIPNTGTELDPNNVKMISGDEFNICTIPGKKSITFTRGAKTYKVMNVIDIKNSDWFTLVRGKNLFTYFAETGDEKLRFAIYTKVLYEGV